MPISFQIDPRHEIVFSTAEGMISDEELLASQAAIGGHADFRVHFSQLYDFREADFKEVAAQVVGVLARSDPFSGMALRAFLARTPLQYGVLRMYISMCMKAGESMKIFENRDEALEWLKSQSDWRLTPIAC